MITTNAAHAMNINNQGLHVGKSANLVVLKASNALEALREHAAPLHVISHGKLIDPARMEAVRQTGDWQ